MGRPLAIVVATTNQGKLKEFCEILKDQPIEILSLADFGPIPEVVEDGETFDDNAYKKALFTAKVLGLPAIADDSGLTVEALDGKPGVYSARFAGEDASDQDNIDKLLKDMDSASNRKAAFKCVLSLAVPSGPALTYEGRCIGEILTEQKGDGGFGYDPVFFSPEIGKTFAEANSEEKNKISHRGKALTEMKSEFSNVLKWLAQRLLEEKPEKPDESQFMHNDWSKPNMV